MLAPTWAVELLRMTVAGITEGAVFWQKLMMVIVLSGMGAIFSAWLYKKIDKSVRIQASLEVC